MVSNFAIPHMTQESVPGPPAQSNKSVSVIGQESGDLSLLGRYQRVLLFGGGIALSIVIVFATSLVLYGTVKDYIAERRSVFMVHKSLVQLEIDSKEAELRRAVNNAELLWSGHPAPTGSLLKAFEAANGRVIVQANPNFRPILAMGQMSAPQSSPPPAEYLGLVEQQAYTAIAGTHTLSRPATGYAYSPDYRFIAIVPAPKGGGDAVFRSTGTHDVTGLIRYLAFDIGDLSNVATAARWDATRHIALQPAAVDPLTGERVFKMVEPGFKNNKPFIIFAADFPVDILMARFEQGPGDATIMLVDRAGRVLLSKDLTRASIDGDALMRESLASKSWQRGFVRLDDSYRDGVFSVSDRVSDTDWALVYSYSWRTIAIALWPTLLRYIATTLLMLGTLWILLLLFNRKVFVPVYSRSRRVFESENLNRAIMMTSPFGVSLVSLVSEEVLLQNAMMERYAAMARVAAPPLHRQMLAAYRQQASGDATLADSEMVFEVVGSGKVDLLINAVRTKYHEAEALLCSFSDITARKDIERKREEARIAADEANRAKSAFLATMSHEIRTPLNAILGNLELLAHSPLNVVQMGRLETIRTSSDGLLATIGDILDFSKIEAGEMSFEQIEFDVIGLAERALMLFAPVARTKGLQLYGVFNMASAAPMWGDPIRVGQIVNNMLSNAIKFTQAGKVTLRLSIASVADGDDTVFITVEDTGIGMSPEQQRKLFRAFSQADASINRRFGGSGLGLALSHRLATAMGGAISVTSEPGAGSCFTVRLSSGAMRIAAREPAVFSGESVIFLSAMDEWREFAVPHLEAWGLQVTVFRHPAGIADDSLRAACVLIICGEHDAWDPSQENHLVEDAASVIDCHFDGPALPVRTGRITSVSCYSLKGLEMALRKVLRDEDPETTASPQAAAHAADSEGARLIVPNELRVLVCEDNIVNQQLFTEQLAMLGCRSLVVGCGKDAMDALTEGRWDVLLTDLNMPEMSGFELATAVRARWPSLPIMAVTAYATIEEHARCAKAGMNRVLLKPLSLGELYDVLANVADAARASLTRPENEPLSVLGSRPIPQHLRSIFTESCTASLKAIHVAYESGDVATVLAQLHSLHGALGVFGQTLLAQQCKDIESQVRSNGLGESAPQFIRFEAAALILVEQ
ncbi:response regulator [Paraburkholderia aspalathi]|uniref:hybrid sensor histidine kinase/response regulator n=1 Tax=Paraburkholderia nemoris TaxID=2793076 RepID=UPI00190CB93F|nr:MULTISPECIES: hybrid sensor histidine kinase/response regulator [Paraburkholderia]MBK3787195.1 response regulator [Paraburkholderia aspalathi]